MLYIMRHGKTDWNDLGIIQGKKDIPLNDEGRRMAETACIEYADINIDICYSSPLVRAVETAEIFLKNRDISLIIDDRLKEMGFGEFEGVRNNHKVDKSPINIIFDKPSEYTDSICGVESFGQLFKRTGEFINEKIKPQIKQGLDILIVGHAAMNASIICQIEGIPISDFWLVGENHCKLKRIYNI